MSSIQVTVLFLVSVVMAYWCLSSYAEGGDMHIEQNDLSLFLQFIQIVIMLTPYFIKWR